MIDRLCDRHPGLTANVTLMSRPITVEIRELRERNVDLIIGRGASVIPEDDLNSDILFEESFIVVAGVRGPRARRRKLGLARLLDEKWIPCPPKEAPGTVIQQAFSDRGLRVPERASPPCPITYATCCC